MYLAQKAFGAWNTTQRLNTLEMTLRMRVRMRKNWVTRSQGGINHSLICLYVGPHMLWHPWNNSSNWSLGNLNLLKHICHGPIPMKGESVPSHDTSHDGEAWLITSRTNDTTPAKLAISPPVSVDKNDDDWGGGDCLCDMLGWPAAGVYTSEVMSPAHTSLSSSEAGCPLLPSREFSLSVSISPNKFDSLGSGLCFLCLCCCDCWLLLLDVECCCDSLSDTLPSPVLVIRFCSVS